MFALRAFAQPRRIYWPLWLLAVAAPLGLTSWVAADTHKLPPAERARGLLEEVARAGTPPEFTARPRARVEELLARAEREAPPEQAALLRFAALEWAELAHDLVRARSQEQNADRLELEVSAMQTEIARARAAVEQAKARLGRAQQELKDLTRARPEAR